MAKRDKDQEAKELAAAAEIARQRAAGNDALNQAKADDAAKSDEQKAAEEEEARVAQEAAAAEEAERAAAEQHAAEAELARLAEEAAAQAKAERQASAKDDESVDFGEAIVPALPPDARLLKAGTIVHLNGVECMLPFDAALVIPHAADEQQFASVLARDPANFALNSERLRLVYSQMNGSPLPLGSQRLKLEEMTDQERALFEAPPSRPKR
jgi:flagellar biosynthesis GTPase FlhF